MTNTGTGNCNAAISNISASPRLTYVTATASGEGDGNFDVNIGVSNISSSPTMTNVTATASGSFQNDGVVNVSSSPTIKQSTLGGTDASLLLDNGGTTKIADTQLVGPVTAPGGVLQCFGNYNENMAAVTCP